MSEPKNKPEREEPSIGNSADIKPTAPAANGNDSKVEPVVGVTPPAVSNLSVSNDDTAGRKEPVMPAVLPTAEAPKADKVEPVMPPAAAITLPAASEPAAPVNDNITAPAAAPAAAAASTPAPAASAEAPPVPPTPPADAPAAAAKPSRMRGFLKGAFNFAVSAGMGFGASFAIKATFGTALVAASVPAWATIGLTSALIGVSAALIADAKNRHEKKKEGQELSKYFSRAHGKELLSKRSLVTFGISTAGAVLGSVVAAGFQDGTIQNAWNNFWGNNPQPVPPVIVPPVTETIVPPTVTEVVPPVVEPVPPTVAEVVPPPVVVAPVCLTPAEQFSQLIDGHDVSSRVSDAMTRAASTNPAIAAQGTKDLAFFAFNGFDGVPKDANVAVELFKQAAEGGNAQAKVDLVYMQYHGLGGIEADPKAAVATMKSLPGARAAHFVQAWGGTGKSVAKAAFSTDAIFKGMAVGCPKL